MGIAASLSTGGPGNYPAVEGRLNVLQSALMRRYEQGNIVALQVDVVFPLRRLAAPPPFVCHRCDARLRGFVDHCSICAILAVMLFLSIIRRMTVTRFITLSLCTLLGLSLNLATAHSAPPQRNRQAVIHVLIAADTNDQKIGKGVEVDLTVLRDFFEKNVPAAGLDLVSLSGNQATRNDILRTIDMFSCQPNDAMAVFWTGHGAYDARGHYFSTSAGPLYRTEVMVHVKNRGAGMNAVISDCCNVYVPGELFMESVAKLPTISPLLTHLFLKSRGTVDLNGASEGEFGICDPAKNGGGAFIGPFVELAEANSQYRLDWDKYVELLRPAVRQAFERACPKGQQHPDGTIQRTQTVRIWGDLPKSIGGQDQVARRVSLERGDVILAVNGQPIQDSDECVRAVEASRQTIEIRVRDARTGAVRNLRGELLPPPSRLGIKLVDGKDGATVARVYFRSPATRLLEIK